MNVRKPRLLFVTSFYPPVSGSGSSRISDFARFLASKGFKVCAITFSDIHRLSKGGKILDVEVINIPTIGFKHPIDQIFTSFFGTLIACLAKSSDFILASIPMGEPCIGAYLACRIMGKKIIVDVRDEWEDAVIKKTRRFVTRNLYRLYKRTFNGILRKSTFVTTVSPTLEKKLRGRGCTNVYLLPNGADTELFHPLSEAQRQNAMTEMGLRENDFIVTYVGRVGWYYQIDNVIDAFQIIIGSKKRSNFRFLILGSGERSEEFHSLRDQYGLRNYITFLGERSRLEVAKILACSNIGVIPFEEDPLWLSAYTTKVFEYFASGLPVLVCIPKGADLEKLVERHKVGFTMEPNNPEILAETIIKLSKEKEQLKKMGACARRLAEKVFSRSKIVEEFVKIIEEYYGQ